MLVALDPAVEDALERFDAVLADPAIAVIFDEAELAAQPRRLGRRRAGSRHLAAKLHRHDDVLPPGGETESAWHPSPGLPRHRPADRKLELDIAPFTGEAQAACRRRCRAIRACTVQDLSLVEDFAFDADDASAQYRRT